MQIDCNLYKKIVSDVVSKRDFKKINEETIWHNHHILPKHLGGKNDKENLVKVTVDEHATIHKKLFKKFNQKQDWLAWQGLAGFLGKEKIISESIKLGSRKAGKIAGRKAVESGRLIEMSKKGVKKFREKFLNEKKYKNHFSKISKLQKGVEKPKLRNYIWITNGVENKKIHINEIIPPEFKKGRTRKWRTGFNREKKEKICCPHCNKIGGKPVMKRYHFEYCKLKGSKNAIR